MIVRNSFRTGLTALTALATAAALLFVVRVADAGTLRSAGSNWAGELGTGGSVPLGQQALVPVQVVNLSGVVSTKAGHYFGLALLADGTVWSWGYNGSGELGDGTTIGRDFPAPVQDPGDPSGLLNNVVAIGAGRFHALAVKRDGSLWGWGNNSSHQLATGSVGNPFPARVMDPSDPTGYLTGVLAADGGSEHSVALKADGSVWAWGTAQYNMRGTPGSLIGDGTTMDRPYPVRVLNITNAVAVDATDSFSMVLGADGQVWTWGDNWAGQLGDGTFTERNYPVAVFSHAQAIAAGGWHGLVLRDDNTVWGAGYNNNGELGNGTNIDSPVFVRSGSLTGVTAIGSGVYSGTSIAVKSDGSAWGWGDNTFGDGTTNYRSSPVRVTDPDDATGYLNGVTAASADAFSLFLVAKAPIRVSSIAMSTRTGGKSTNAVAKVTILNEFGEPVVGAVVEGHWSGLTADVDTGTTAADGTVSLSSNAVRSANGTFTFILDSVIKDGFIWDSYSSPLQNSITYP